MASIDVSMGIIAEAAFNAAEFAAKEFIDEFGEPMFCGFAWVNVTPGNSAMARYLVENCGARKSSRKGVDVWNPSKSFTQSMDVRYAGAVAFAEALQVFGIQAEAMSRGD